MGLPLIKNCFLPFCSFYTLLRIRNYAYKCSYLYNFVHIWSISTCTSNSRFFFFSKLNSVYSELICHQLHDEFCQFSEWKNKTTNTIFCRMYLRYFYIRHKKYEYSDTCIHIFCEFVISFPTILLDVYYVCVDCWRFFFFSCTLFNLCLPLFFEVGINI